MIRLCFVCLGNIVRSPLAENLFLHLVAQKGLEGRYTAASAGVANYHVGEHPDSRMRQVARARGLVYDGRGRQFERRDFERFDLILAMDGENLAGLRWLASTPEEKTKLHLLREFDPQCEAGKPGDVPDPYYGGMGGFEDVYDIVERSCQGLLAALENGTGLDGKQ